MSLTRLRRMLRMLIHHAGRIVGHTGGIVGYEPVAPVPNAAPVAAFSADPDDLMVRVDGGASTDPDGIVVAYQWVWGDGTTSTGPTSAHTYTQAGTYTVTLTVTDDDGATAQASQTITVAVPNLPPVAALETSVNGLTVQVDAGASSDTDGVITTYAWEFGDGSTATDVLALHTYAAPGTYTVTLTVTDDDGATSTTSRAVTAVAAILPTPVLTSISEPVPGAVRIDWQPVEGATEYRVYETDSAANGPIATVLPPATSRQSGAIWVSGDEPDYWITALVNGVETPPSNVLSIVIVGTEPDPTEDPGDSEVALVQDPFDRTVTSGMGTAPIGGAWTATANVTRVDGNAAVFTLADANSWASARLPSVSTSSVSVQVTTWCNKIPNGSGAYQLLRPRIVPGPPDHEYRFKVNLTASGALTAWCTISVSGTETTLSAAPVTTPPGVTYTANTRIIQKAEAIGTNPTRIRTKVWIEGQPEPAAWLHDFTDSTPQLQAPGHVGVYTQLSGGTNNGPIEFRYDNVIATGVSAPTTPPPDPDPEPEPDPEPDPAGLLGTFDRISSWKSEQEPAVRGVKVNRITDVTGADVPGQGQTYTPSRAVRFENRPFHNANDFTVTATAGATATATSLAVSSTDAGRLVVTEFMLNRRTGEYLRVTGKSGSTLSVQRNCQGSASGAQPINAGDVLEVAGGDVNDSGNSYPTSRVELMGNYPSPWSTPAAEWPDPAGSSRWYSYALYLPTSFNDANGTQWITLHQFKGYRTGSPPLSHEVKNGQYHIGGARGSSTLHLGSTSLGQWVFFEYFITWSNDPAVGRLQAFRNGVEVVPLHARATMNTTSGNPDSVYLKQGIYRTKGHTTTHVAYYGPTRRGTTRASVAFQAAETETGTVPATVTETV